MNEAKNKRIFVPIFLITFLIAGLLDLKYKGLFYRLLPSPFQSYSDTFLGKFGASFHHDRVLK